MSPTVCSRESSALQVLVSGRIIINGILNEILQLLSEEKLRSEFTLESQCSIMMDSETRRNQDFRAIDRIAMSISSSTLADDKGDKSSYIDSGLYSLYKETQGTDEYVSDVCGLEDKNHSKRPPTEARPIINKQDQISAPALKSIDISKMSSTWKGFGTDSRKSSKSVTFTSPENTVFIEPSPTGMLVEPQPDAEMENLLQLTSISAKVACRPYDDRRDSDLWLAFLVENGLPVNSETSLPCDQEHRDTKTDDPNFIVNQLDNYKEIPSESFTTHIRDTYEEIHRNTPGLFFDTVSMDNPKAAFQKMKRLIKSIVNSQQDLKPMVDIDFNNMKNCSLVKKKLANICNQIAPQRLFY